MEYHQQLSEFFMPVKTTNNYTKVVVNGPDCLDLYLNEIKKAKHYIHLQVMVFYSDEAGIKIANALAAKAREGVLVRVMTDADMSNLSRGIEIVRSKGTSSFTRVMELFAPSGVKAQSSAQETYDQAKWQQLRAELAKKGMPENFLLVQDQIQQYVAINATVVDHRKFMVIDGETAIVSSMNVGNMFMYTDPVIKGVPAKEKQWHDGCLVIKGECASALNALFASKWMIRGGDLFDFRENYRDDKIYGNDICSVFHTYPGDKCNHIRNYFLKKIREAKGEFIIENPYINDEVIWKALANLAPEQAKKIKIINPYQCVDNDYPQNLSSIRCHIWKPFKKGISFYNYSQRMSHWKIALDVEASEVFHGSYNLNYRSALHDFELNVLVESPRLAKEVYEILKHDMDVSEKIEDANEFYKYPLLHLSCYLQEATDYFE